jgi:hypothetical protein
MNDHKSRTLFKCGCSQHRVPTCLHAKNSDYERDVIILPTAPKFKEIFECNFNFQMIQNATGFCNHTLYRALVMLKNTRCYTMTEWKIIIKLVRQNEPFVRHNIYVEHTELMY